MSQCTSAGEVYSSRLVWVFQLLLYMIAMRSVFLSIFSLWPHHSAPIVSLICGNFWHAIIYIAIWWPYFFSLIYSSGYLPKGNVIIVHENKLKILVAFYIWIMVHFFYYSQPSYPAQFCSPLPDSFIDTPATSGMPIAVSLHAYALCWILLYDYQNIACTVHALSPYHIKVLGAVGDSVTVSLSVWKNSVFQKYREFFEGVNLLLCRLDLGLKQSACCKLWQSTVVYLGGG